MGEVEVHRLSVTGFVCLTLALTACGGQDTHAGDCYAEPPRVLDQEHTVDCERATHQVVAVSEVEWEDDAWPGDRQIASDSFGQCLDVAQNFVGGSLAANGLDVWFQHPTEDQWDEGDRTFVCAVMTLRGTPLDGSVEGVAS